MKNIAFLLLLASWALTSCESFFSQTVEIDPPPYDKQLVYHLNLTDQDSTFRFVLSRNFGILETVRFYDDYFVKGGTAELYKDGQKWLTFTPLSTDSSFVFTGVFPEPLQSGSTYEMRIKHPDFPPTTATQTMPNPLQVDSVRIKKNAVLNGSGDKLDLIDVFLRDESGVPNFYAVVIYAKYPEIEFDPITGNIDTVGYFEYPKYVDDYADPNVVEGFQGAGLISDQFFDGQAYKFQARVYSNYNETFRVEVLHITPDYYQWSRSYTQKLDADENPLVEPISIFTNITDGLGIFSLARSEIFLLQ